MRYLKRFIQTTVREENSEAFDMRMNEVYEKASRNGKLPEVHYFEGQGLCATVRYWYEEHIPECISEAYELKGEVHRCFECPYFTLPKDRRIKNVRCEHENRLVDSSTSACDYYYKNLEEQEREA